MTPNSILKQLVDEWRSEGDGQVWTDSPVGQNKKGVSIGKTQCANDLEAAIDRYPPESTTGMKEVDSENPFVKNIREKQWFWEDDHIARAEEPVEEFYWWYTETYIASTQIRAAFDDSDVDVGVIDPDENQNFKIALYPPPENTDR